MEKTKYEFQAREELSRWFGLSRASFLTLPRVLMEDMPASWQKRMARLLREYSGAFPNQPDIGTRVVITRNGRAWKTPDWIVNYRHPDRFVIMHLRGKCGDP